MGKTVKELEGELSTIEAEINKAESALSLPDILPEGKDYWGKALPVFREKKFGLEQEIRQITMH